jgi:hypothetical protein
MSDYDAIQSDVRQRGITRLCHFMQSRKLQHILAQTQTLLPTQQLRERYPDLLDVTDTERLDGHLNHICCSVEYPNPWYFQKVRERDQLFTDWVILCLDPALLWERDALFSPRNAAAQYGALLQSGWQGWQALFVPQVAGAHGKMRRRTPQMLAWCPTDGQAEALIPDAIPQRYITAVIVQNEEQAHKEQVRLTCLKVNTTFAWIVAPTLFTRPSHWNELARQGKRPDERQLVK